MLNKLEKDIRDMFQRSRLILKDLDISKADESNNLVKITTEYRKEDGEPSILYPFKYRSGHVIFEEISNKELNDKNEYGKFLNLIGYDINKITNKEDRQYMKDYKIWREMYSR